MVALGISPLVLSANYYDIYNDLLVDRFEAGCNYTINPLDTDVCTGTGVGCIGTSTGYNLAGDSDTPNGSVFYQRDTGKCFYRESNTWTEVASLGAGATVSDMDINADHSIPHLPPLTFINQVQANDYCVGRTTGTITNLTTDCDPVLGGTENDCRKRLMRRVEQVAVSAWSCADSSTCDATNSTLETGASLSTSTSQCNSSTGGSLTFTDAEVPPSALADTLPGTNSSSITSLRTGSTATASCVSRYGIQDLVGNVSEWLSDQMSCPTSAFDDCLGITSNPLDSGNTFMRFNNASATDYDMDGNEGPEDAGATNITNWKFATQSFLSTHFYWPMGLPAVSGSYGGSNNYAHEIDGSSSPKITTAQLKGDLIYVNSSDINAVAGNTAGTISGGDYSIGSDSAGRYYLKFVPLNGVNTGVTTPEQAATTGFRCIANLPY